MIHYIDKDGFTFRFIIYGQPAQLTQCSLYTQGLTPLPPKVKGSTLGWHIAGKFVSYNQLKKVICNTKLK